MSSVRASVYVGAFIHQRKGEERDFPQGNAEGRDSGARESWLEDERASWVICVSVGRLDFCATLCFPYVVRWAA